MIDTDKPPSWANRKQRRHWNTDKALEIFHAKGTGGKGCYCEPRGIGIPCMLKTWKLKARNERQALVAGRQQRRLKAGNLRTVPVGMRPQEAVPGYWERWAVEHPAIPADKVAEWKLNH